MGSELWRKGAAAVTVMMLALVGASMTGCEDDEPDNGVQIEGDNGVDVETDAPGDE